MPELNLDKLYRSSEELLSPEVAEITGKIPEWVQGIYLRVGPGKFDFRNFTVNHWLDGYSIVSKFDIHGNSVTFYKRFLQTDAYINVHSLPKDQSSLSLEQRETQTQPKECSPDLFRAWFVMVPIELSDNNQQSLFKVGNDVFASSETCYFRQLDIDTLAAGDKCDTNRLFRTNIASAHPLTDESTGTIYNIGVTCLTGLKYHIIKIPSASSPKQSSKDQMKKSKMLCTIPSSWTGMLSYVHSFGMTTNYIVFIEQPYVMNITKAFLSVIKGQGYCFKDWLDWRPELKNRFFIIEKSTGKCISTDVVSENPFLFLHFINCYEDNGQIVMDLIVYKNPSILEGMTISKLRSGSGVPNEGSQPSAAQRFVIPLLSVELKDVSEKVNLVEVKSSAVAFRRGNQIILTPEILTEPGLEFPMVNRDFHGRKHGYFWATGSTAQGYFENSICKVDTKMKDILLWRDASTNFPGEPMFVHNPNSVEEDDGVIISAVTDVGEHANDFLLFLDAKTMKEIGRAKFKSHIPQAIHGLFIKRS